MDNNATQQNHKGEDYYLFISADEKVVFKADGVLNNIIAGTLILTDNKLFFYFISNISRDKTFIATYPYIVSAELKQGLTSSTLIIRNKKESFEIRKINKKDARRFYEFLNKIISENK